MEITPRVDLDVMIMQRITDLNDRGIKGQSFAERLEELLWLRDQVKNIPYTYISNSYTGDK